jgi:hypothetical protein
VSKYVTSELYVIIGLTNESKRLLATLQVNYLMR